MKLPCPQRSGPCEATTAGLVFASLGSSGVPSSFLNSPRTDTPKYRKVIPGIKITCCEGDGNGNGAGDGGGDRDGVGVELEEEVEVSIRGIDRGGS